MWLVTARSGSKGLKHKNIRLLAKKPLLAYRIISAKKVKIKSQVWISTDSKKYAQIAKKYGAKAPFLRPKKLSGDMAKSVDVALHAITWAEKNNIRFKLIGVLEPTSPFVRPKQLKQAVSILDKNPAASGIVATKNVTPNTYLTQQKAKYLSKLAKRLKKLQDSRRQALSAEITPSGGFYITKISSLKKYKSFYTPKTLSYTLESPCDLEIDTKIDFMWAKFVKSQCFDKKS